MKTSDDSVIEARNKVRYWRAGNNGNVIIRHMEEKDSFFPQYMMELTSWKMIVTTDEYMEPLEEVNIVSIPLQPT